MFVGNIHSCAFLTHNRFSDCTGVPVYLCHHAFLFFFMGYLEGKKARNPEMKHDSSLPDAASNYS